MIDARKCGSETELIGAAALDSSSEPEHWVPTILAVPPLVFSWKRGGNELSQSRSFALENDDRGPLCGPADRSELLQKWHDLEDLGHRRGIGLAWAWGRGRKTACQAVSHKQILFIRRGGAYRTY